MRGNWRPNRTATYSPPPLLRSSAFLSRSPGLLNRVHGVQPLWVLVFSTASPTAWISCALSFIIVQRPLPSCGRHNFALIQPVHGQGYNILIFLDRMHMLFIQVHFQFITVQPGRSSICNNHPIIIFQNSTSGIFLHVCLHHPHTHILQNNSPGQW